MHLTKSIRQLVFELNRGAPDEFDANNPVSDVGLTSLSAAFASFGQGPQQRSSNPTMFYCALRNSSMSSSPSSSSSPTPRSVLIGGGGSDRAAKYGWGLPRLVLVCLIAFELAPRASSAISPASQAALSLLPYLQSGRWIGHLYIGSIGAAVNVQIRSFTFNLCMLIGAAALIVFDMRLDYAILIYMLKTFSGDFIAGKLDTLEWRLVLLFTGLVAVAAW